LRVAFFTPLPPSPTGVADYSQTLLESLASLQTGWHIDAYTESDVTAVQKSFAVHPSGEFSSSSPASSALPVYQMGNSAHHDFIYPFVFKHPGVLVLHDLVLHHSRLASYIASPELTEYRRDLGNEAVRARALARLDEYAAEVEAAYPGKGSKVAEVAIRTGGGRLLYAYPLYELLVRSSKMTLVHSLEARRQVEEACPESTIRRVRMGVEAPQLLSRVQARQKLGLGGGVILASFGLVTPEKRITTALQCVKRLLDEGSDITYLLVGGSVPHFDALEEAHRLGISDRVKLTGRVSDEDFWLYAFAADLCLNLRFPSAGETSATLLQLMAAGRAVMITDQAQGLELPDSVVARSSLEGDEDGLFCDVKDLLRHSQRRRKIEESARQFATAEHSVDAMVKDYVSVLEEAYSLPSPEIKRPRHLTSKDHAR
jgi:glycosyltransferase involved in cell wall biosynthesis